MPAAIVDVDWEIARDDLFRTIVQKGTAPARPELGHSVHVEVTGLEPGREYWYRFRAGDELSQTGRTKTAPPAGGPVDRLRFGVCGCSHYEMGYFTAFRRLAEEQFDFVFHTGDYIYEGRADGGRNARVRQHNSDEIYTLVDYRNRYALYKADRDLMAARASAPFVMAWDDHEVDNNMHWGADLEADYANPRSATIGVEFTNSSVTSIGDGWDVAPNWNDIKGDNPHIKYHSARRGYTACTATPAQMRADFKILDRVTVADLPVRTGGSLVVEAGRAGSYTD